MTAGPSSRGATTSMIGLTTASRVAAGPAAPIRATIRTVISTIVSRPRKSARITVTTSPPCASGARRMCSAASLRPSGGRDRAAHTAANALTPASSPAPRCQR